MLGFVGLSQAITWPFKKPFLKEHDNIIAGPPLCNVILERDLLDVHVGYTISLGTPIYPVLVFYT